MKKRILIDSYRIKDKSESIILKIIIGYKQKAITTIDLDEKRVVDGLDESRFYNSFEIGLGQGEDLQGKELFVSTIVHEIPDDTDKTSITLKLFEGAVEYEAVMRSTMTEKGNAIRYGMYLDFY